MRIKSKKTSSTKNNQSCDISSRESASKNKIKKNAEQVVNENNTKAIEPFFKKLSNDGRGKRELKIRAEGKEPLTIRSDGMLIWAYDTTGAQICGGKNTSYGKGELALTKNKYCTRRDVHFPSGRCGRHHGKTQRGIDHPNFNPDRTSTRYSGFQRKERDQIRESLDDPNLTSLREDIAAADVHLKQITKTLGGIDPEIVNSVYSSVDELTAILKKGYETEEELQFIFASVLDHIKLVKKLKKKEISWRELKSAQLHRAKLVQVENQRMVSEQTQIPVEKVAGLVQRLTRGFMNATKLASEKIIEKWFQLSPEMQTPRSLQTLIVDTVQKAIMEDIRPVVTVFFPRPIKAKNAVITDAHGETVARADGTPIEPENAPNGDSEESEDGDNSEPFINEPSTQKINSADEIEEEPEIIEAEFATE